MITDVKIKFNCEKCEDTGIVTKTEWANDDDSYDVEEANRDKWEKLKYD